MRMSSSFHLAIPAGDLKKAEAFYTNILGCKTGNREDGKWIDICLLYTSPSPRDTIRSRMPSSA